MNEYNINISRDRDREMLLSSALMIFEKEASFELQKIMEEEIFNGDLRKIRKLIKDFVLRCRSILDAPGMTHTENITRLWVEISHIKEKLKEIDEMEIFIKKYGDKL